MFKKVLIVLVVGVGGFLVFAATRPDTYHVERTSKIDAPADVVFEQLDDLKKWAQWSPWEKLDPSMQKTYGGPARGVGANYAWQGNDKVGKGKMEITESQPPSKLGFRLEFIEPFSAVASTGFVLTPAGDQATSVTWSMDGNNNFIGKIFGLFMDMDKQIGGDFERGLAGLKPLAEVEGKRRAEAAAAAKAKAEADAAAAAKAKAEEEAAAAAKLAEEEAAKKKGGKKKK